MNPETALDISIIGAAGRLASSDTTAIDAANELRELADGRTDMLGKAAGHMLGGVIGSSLTNPQNILAAYYLVLAGAEHEPMVTELDVVRGNVDRAGYSLGGSRERED